jgi:transcriptional regulator with XRE-family HTH domain
VELDIAVVKKGSWLMDERRMLRTPRQKYGEEMRLRRTAARLTQEELGDQVVCSPTLISHFEAGRRLPKPDDAQRIDRALGTDGFFARWLEDLESHYTDHFAAVAELEQLAAQIQQFALSLVPGVLQTDDYARALFAAYRPNHTTEELDELVVIRTQRRRILDGPAQPVVWTLLDEASSAVASAERGSWQSSCTRSLTWPSRDGCACTSSPTAWGRTHSCRVCSHS